MHGFVLKSVHKIPLFWHCLKYTNCLKLYEEFEGPSASVHVQCLDISIHSMASCLVSKLLNLLG